METNATFAFIFILFDNWGSPLQFSHQLIGRAAQEGKIWISVLSYSRLTQIPKWMKLEIIHQLNQTL